MLDWRSWAYQCRTLRKIKVEAKFSLKLMHTVNRLRTEGCGWHSLSCSNKNCFKVGWGSAFLSPSHSWASFIQQSLPFCFTHLCVLSLSMLPFSYLNTTSGHNAFQRPCQELCALCLFLSYCVCFSALLSQLLSIKACLRAGLQSTGQWQLRCQPFIVAEHG